MEQRRVRGGLLRVQAEDCTIQLLRTSVIHASSRNMGALETAMNVSKNDNHDVIAPEMILTSHNDSDQF